MSYDEHSSGPEPEQRLLSALDGTLWLARVLERTRAPLTSSQFRIMRRAAAGGERAARLADHLAVRKPTLTAIADGLVAAGFLIRESDNTDRRIVRLQLTPLGREALAETERVYADRFGELLDDAPDRDALLGQLSGLEFRRVARLTGGTTNDAKTTVRTKDAGSDEKRAPRA